jgi:nicotinic acid mononucleotide adenylyltransferase
MKSLIREIHESDTYGVILETGCGVPVASNLLSVPGASATVYMSECPYAREYCHDTYGNKGYRAVSQHYVHAMLNSERWLNVGINTVYASSFQVGEYNNVLTHGWIGLKCGDAARYFHVTINEAMSREEYITRIGEIGVRLLHARNAVECLGCDVDIVLGNDLETDYEATLRHLSSASEAMALFGVDGVDRIDTVYRGSEEIILYKGSFNPVHKAHLRLMEHAMGVYPDAKPYFMISCDVYDKGRIDVSEMRRRIDMLNTLGYDVVVSKKPLFKDTVEYVRRRFSGKIVLVMGLDTIERVMLDYSSVNEMVADFAGTEFMLANRTDNPDTIAAYTHEAIHIMNEAYYLDCSSTKVREAMLTDDREYIQRNVPEAVIAKLI